MKELSVEDVRRILQGGERFLLVRAIPTGGCTQPTLIPDAVDVAVDAKFDQTVFSQAGSKTVPVVIYGGGDGSEITAAARQLVSEGFAEVWTYCGDPSPWLADPETAPMSHVAQRRHEHSRT